MLRKSLLYFGPIFLMHLNNRIGDCCFPESGIRNPESCALENVIQLKEAGIPIKIGYMRRFLQLRPEFFSFFFICEFGNASKATSCVRCNINIGQPHFQEFEVAILFLVPCLSSYPDGEKLSWLCHSDQERIKGAEKASPIHTLFHR